jgi:hypothetical protein
MGNPLKSVTQTLTKLDPITHAVSPGGKYDAFNTTTGAAAPAYNPANNPGARLTPAPGGVNQLPTTGATPGGAPNGYTPNYFQQNSQPPPPTGGPSGTTVSPLAPRSPVGPQTGPNGVAPRVSPFRGGTPQLPQVPGAQRTTQPINPALGQQSNIANLLRRYQQ